MAPSAQTPAVTLAQKRRVAAPSSAALGMESTPQEHQIFKAACFLKIDTGLRTKATFLVHSLSDIPLKIVYHRSKLDTF